MIIKLAMKAVLIPNTENIGPGKNILYEVPSNIKSMKDNEKEKFIKSIKSHKGIAHGYLLGSMIPASGVAGSLEPRIGIPLALGIVTSGYGLGKLHEYLRTRQKQKFVKNEITNNRIKSIHY